MREGAQGGGGALSGKYRVWASALHIWPPVARCVCDPGVRDPAPGDSIRAAVGPVRGGAPTAPLAERRGVVGGAGTRLQALTPPNCDSGIFPGRRCGRRPCRHMEIT